MVALLLTSTLHAQTSEEFLGQKLFGKYHHLFPLVLRKSPILWQLHQEIHPFECVIQNLIDSRRDPAPLIESFVNRVENTKL